MKKMLATVVAAMFVASMAFTAFAEEMTIKGEAMCTKCSMHETDQCGCAIKTAEGTVYYADKNDVAKKFHKNICQANAKVVATGKVEDKDGKKVITLTKIEVDKDAK